MRERITIRVRMELLSDAIFGSGYSIPGGEDIAVCRDGRGYPYLKGATLKGLLRESARDLLFWMDADPAAIAPIFGEEGWQGEAGDRRLTLTALTLEAPPADPADCFCARTFTKLADGVVETGTLRTAACIRRGLVFTGTMECAAEDAPLLQNALLGVKWAGAMRHRGFGRVRLNGEVLPTAETPAGAQKNNFPETRCIRYHLHNELPVLITDLGRSQGNNCETRGYIPGSAVRGMVLSQLAAREPEWFSQHRAALLGDGTRFLDALPDPAGKAVLPALMGFYEDKEERQFVTVLRDGTVPAGLKRARLGAFCAPEGEQLLYWSAATGGATRIQRHTGDGEDTKPFQTRYLEPGQDFTGCILLDDPALAPALAGVLNGTVWLGADRYEGFGRCRVTPEPAQQPAWRERYGLRDGEAPGEELYLLAVSPLAMLDEKGDPCGLNTATLAKLLGVKSVKVRFCATALAEFGGYNRTWQCRAPAVRMYDRGSLFRLQCGGAPTLAALRAVEEQGLGIRRAEGFGQVLFLRPALFEGLQKKQPLPRQRQTARAGAALRRARYTWIMENSARVRGSKLSKSQLGTVQALCEKAMARGGDLAELQTFFSKNCNDRGARHAERFRAMNEFLFRTLDTPVPELLGMDGCDDSMAERLRLVCQLFNYSRKEADQDGLSLRDPL